ncbi:MAG TPA: ATP-binding protein [Blastocatellia bacterium]|nr:ATP-binding protein [Blastocatellia bacterium]
MPNVLVVDGEPDVRWMMAESLQRGGYHALVAADYAGAVEIVARRDVDAAVTALIPPRQHALDLLRQLREPFIPVVMITGQADLAHLAELVRFGVYDFVSKPVAEAELLRAVSGAVEQKHLAHLRQRLEAKVRHHTEDLERAVAERTRQLAEANRFLSMVLDSSTEYAFIATDTDGRITLYNTGAEVTFGHSARQMLDRPLDELIRDAGRGAGRLLARARAATTERHAGEEVELRRADGGLFVGSVTVTPIRKPGDELTGFLCVIKDLTADRRSQEHMRQLRERLAQNEKIAALGRMAAQVAHEVRNPLAGMRLYALHLRETLADRIADDELAMIDKIADAITKLSDTTEQVLSFARPVKLKRRRADLNATLRDALSLLEPQTLAKRIRLTLDLSPNGAAACFDEAAMRSSVINLLLNAIQAMPDGGSLRVATAGGEGEVSLTVTDDGCGMSDEQLKNMFEPFYTTKSQGLGLGMSFAARVIEQHGGSVRVDSRVGQGTRVEITLPTNGESPNEVSAANTRC